MATLTESRQTVNTGYICASWTDSGALTVACPLHCPSTIIPKCPDSYFLMEIIFVHSDEARRGSAETGPLRFISRPQSIFVLLLGVHLLITELPLSAPHQPPHPQTTSTAGQQPSAVQMTCSLPLLFGSVYLEESCDQVALWEKWSH